MGSVQKPATHAAECHVYSASLNLSRCRIGYHDSLLDLRLESTYCVFLPSAEHSETQTHVRLCFMSSRLSPLTIAFRARERAGCIQVHYEVNKDPAR